MKNKKKVSEFQISKASIICHFESRWLHAIGKVQGGFDLILFNTLYDRFYIKFVKVRQHSLMSSLSKFYTKGKHILNFLCGIFAKFKLVFVLFPFSYFCF